MDYKAALINLVDRLPEENVDGLKRLYEMAKKEVCKTRCAPRTERRKDDRDKDDELLDVFIRSRLIR